MSEKYKGLIASSGVAIGNLYLFTRDKVVISDNKIGENDTKEEFAKVKKAD